MRPGLPYAALFLAAFGTALPQGRAETANVVVDKETWRMMGPSMRTRIKVGPRSELEPVLEFIKEDEKEDEVEPSAPETGDEDPVEGEGADIDGETSKEMTRISGQVWDSRHRQFGAIREAAMERLRRIKEKMGW